MERDDPRGDTIGMHPYPGRRRGGGFLFISFNDGGLRTTYIHTCIHNPARRGGKMYIYLHQAWARADQRRGWGNIYNGDCIETRLS